MPIYPYECQDCNKDFEVAKRMADIDAEEMCRDCASTNTKRTIALAAIEKSSAVQPYYEPALGCMINSKSHKKQILKDRGLEEVGNTSPESMYKHLEVPREKRIAKSWDDL